MKKAPMTEKSLKSNNVSRSFAFSIGVTEWFFILGLLFLCIGVSFLFGWAWALTAAGAVLLATAFYNDTH